MNKTRLGRLALALACALGLWGAPKLVLADDPPAALYRGGTHHGYDMDEEAGLNDKRGSRNFGGTHDGYAMSLAEGVKIVGGGTLLILK